jgi:hypothetical protein
MIMLLQVTMLEETHIIPMAEYDFYLFWTAILHIIKTSFKVISIIQRTIKVGIFTSWGICFPHRFWICLPFKLLVKSTKVVILADTIQCFKHIFFLSHGKQIVHCEKRAE